MQELQKRSFCVLEPKINKSCIVCYLSWIRHTYKRKILLKMMIYGGNFQSNNLSTVFLLETHRCGGLRVDGTKAGSWVSPSSLRHWCKQDSDINTHMTPHIWMRQSAELREHNTATWHQWGITALSGRNWVAWQTQPCPMGKQVPKAYVSLVSSFCLINSRHLCSTWCNECQGV